MAKKEDISINPSQDQSNDRATNTSESKEKESLINIGALLIEARSNLKLSKDDIAKKLNLSKIIIHNLENNQFNEGLPQTFVRGYLISYATNVGLDVALIKNEFDKQVGNESISLKRVESLSVFEKNKKKEFNSSSPIFKLVTILIIAVALFLVGKFAWEKYQSVHATNDLSGEVIESNEIELNVNNDSHSNDILLEETSNGLDKSDGLDKKEDNRVSINVNEGQSDIATSKVSGLELKGAEKQEKKPTLTTMVEPVNLDLVKLSFSDDCWVNIIDATGNELAFGIKKAGKVMELHGVSPIEVILGDPSATTIVFKDDRIDLTRYRAKHRAKIILQ